MWGIRRLVRHVGGLQPKEHHRTQDGAGIRTQDGAVFFGRGVVVVFCVFRICGCGFNGKSAHIPFHELECHGRLASSFFVATVPLRHP